MTSTQSPSKQKDHHGDTVDVKEEFEYVERDEEDDGEGQVGGALRFGAEETRDILICFLFVLNHVEQSN